MTSFSACGSVPVCLWHCAIDNDVKREAQHNQVYQIRV